MKNKKIVRWITAGLLLYLFFFLPLPYFIERPGSALDINPLVQVDGERADIDGQFMLTTVEMFRATPFTSFFQFLPYHTGYSENQILGEFDEYDDFRTLQQHFMSNSIDMAKVAAFSAAERAYSIDYLGVYVMNVTQESLFRDDLLLGDSIVGINDQSFNNTEEFIQIVGSSEVGETVTLLVERDGEVVEVDGELIWLESTGQPGIGISLVTRTQVDTQPEVTISSGNIGGPSAGLMFALEVYAQINELSLNGNVIAGSGTINEAGEVGRIGGIDKKIIAADREGADIFFVPDDPVDSDILEVIPDFLSNYETALQTARDIDTNMTIVGVTHISEALDYLETLNN
ncbi:Lon-like protease with PDZ domain protein [Alkalibacterium sp. AK22]|uniref:SepM family pheromone-processing serine protease n=1 Tax=Alkalibacterium sp. AK22 TaxID=1229520 RepID=UPI00044BC73F|nr:SepM family pheromone-processing serine protease [Alkalibacterium sp. AK22]EXJ22783.1 Lon-like protease with PDZ domain protein [Alkalibacterium sp. AK22]